MLTRTVNKGGGGLPQGRWGVGKGTVNLREIGGGKYHDRKWRGGKYHRADEEKFPL